MDIELDEIVFESHCLQRVDKQFDRVKVEMSMAYVMEATQSGGANLFIDLGSDSILMFNQVGGIHTVSFSVSKSQVNISQVKLQGDLQSFRQLYRASGNRVISRYRDGYIFRSGRQDWG